MRREKRARSRSAGSDSEAEDGEISKYDTFRRSPPPSSPRRKERKEGDKEDPDSTPVSVSDVNRARVSRYEIVDMMFKEGFEDVLVGTSLSIL